MSEEQLIWDLSDFYKGIDDHQIEKDMESILKAAQQFLNYTFFQIVLIIVMPYK
jgi:hypothetical protein